MATTFTLSYTLGSVPFNLYYHSLLLHTYYRFFSSLNHLLGVWIVPVTNWLWTKKISITIPGEESKLPKSNKIDRHLNTKVHKERLNDNSELFSFLGSVTYPSSYKEYFK